MATSFLYDIDESCQSPHVDLPTLMQILKNEYGIIKATVIDLNGYEDHNKRLKDIEYEEVAEGPSEAIVKISNPIEAKSGRVIDVQYSVCSLLRARGVPTPLPLPTKGGLLWSWQEVQPGLSLPFRVFHILPGSDLEFKPMSDVLAVEIGRVLATLHSSLDGKEEELATSHVPFICAENRDSIRREIDILHERGDLTEENRSLLHSGWDLVEGILYGNLDLFEIGLIHSDFNESNLLAVGDEITGVLDFGDMHRSFRIFDVAAAVVYLSMAARPRISLQQMADLILRGYRSVRPFSAPPGALRVAIIGRLAGSLTYGLRTARLSFRKNSSEYILKVQAEGWNTFRGLMNGDLAVEIDTPETDH